MTIEMINEKFGRVCRGLLKRRWIALGVFVVILFVTFRISKSLLN